MTPRGAPFFTLADLSQPQSIPDRVRRGIPVDMPQDGAAYSCAEATGEDA